MDNLFSTDMDESVSDAASDSEKAINKNISNILSMLDTPSPAGRRSGQLDTPVGKPLDILNGVVAFVEVRSSYENRGKAITRQLVQLGATVEAKFTNEVTHVIFKDGKKSTKDKAQKRGIHFLSVLWIEACKREGAHVPEQNYPAHFKEESGLPLAVTRLKKNKSMQPKDFEEGLANSAEKVERRRKRLEKKEKWKILETPVTPQQYNVGVFHVPDTQSMSPVHFLRSNFLVPETPPSMKRKLEELRRKRQMNIEGYTGEAMSVLETPSTPPDGALQRKLFYNNSPSISPSSSIGSIAFPQLDSTDKSSPLSSPCDDQTGLKRMSLKYETSRKKSPELLKSPVIKSKTNNLYLPKEDNSLSSSPEKMFSTEVNDKKLPVLDSVRGGPSNIVKSRTGKKKLLRLDEVPVEKLLSPIMCLDKKLKSNQKVEAFPPIKKSGKATSTIKLPEDSRPKVKGLKRKTDEMDNSSDSDSSLRKAKKVQKNEQNFPAKLQCTKDNLSQCDKIDTDTKKVADNLKNTEMDSVKSTVKPTKGRRKSLAVSDTAPLRTSRRRSCMPELTSGSVKKKKVNSEIASSIDNSKSEQSSTFDCDSQNGDIYINEQNGAELPKGARKSDQALLSSSLNRNLPDIEYELVTDCIENQSSSSSRTDSQNNFSKNCRKSLQPKHSPVKSTQAIINRRSRRSSVLGQVIKSDVFLEESQGSLCHSIPEESSTTCEVDQTSFTSGSSLMMDKTVSNASDSTINLKKSRKSIEEFTIPKRRTKKSYSISSAIDSSDDDSKICSETLPQKIKKTKRNISGSSERSSEGSCCALSEDTKVQIRKDGFTQSIVMTSLHLQEQDSVRAVVKSLGTYFIEETVSSQTTHVVCGSNRRTLNVLLAISKGCWLVSLEWVLRSLEAGQWLDETRFEQSEFFPAAQISRLARVQQGSENYTPGFFSEEGLIYVAENTAPAHQDLVRLLHLCGGQVTHCARKARVCVGKAKADSVNVSEKWILDTITSHKKQPYDDYKI